jgi:hypothetical protein
MAQSSSIPSRTRIPQQHEFVSGLEKPYSSYIRAHVLKNYLFERRKKAGVRRANSGQDPVLIVEQTACTSTTGRTAVWSPEAADPLGPNCFAAEEDYGEQSIHD